MNEVQGHITQVDTACVKQNQVLALSVSQQDVDRLSRVIREYGLLTPPVIGSFQDGTHLVLSGECEVQALKELGVKKTNAVAIPLDEDNEGDKLALLLSTLPKSPSALSEGILISQLLKTGRYSQMDIGDLLGKSSSWISKRMSLVTRLNPAVREMVTQKLLCPHSAQEIARLPYDVQHDFSVQAVQEGLPKSAVETLISTFNKKDCTDALREHILKAPRHALEKTEQYRMPKSIPTKPEKEIPITTKNFRSDLLLLMHCLKDTAAKLGYIQKEDLILLHELILRAKTGMLRFCSLLEAMMEQVEFSPGKTEQEVSEHAH